MARSDVKAGSVIVVSLGLFALVVVTAGKFGDMFKKKQTLHVLFSDVQGLKVDDPVQVMGLEQGRVLGIEVSQMPPSQSDLGQIPMVEVIAQISYKDELPVDTKITVDRTLTGNTALKIEPGRSVERFKPGTKIVGLGAVSMTEIASKAGVMAKRLDDFLADLTDRNLSGSIRELVSNLKQVSADVKTVTASLRDGIPETQKNLGSAMRNMASISKAVDEVVTGNKEKLDHSIASVEKITKSVAQISDGVDKILEKTKDHIQGSIVHVEKATSNIKALTREVRWQPWVLLNKPDEVEIRERSIYNSALEFSEGAESLNGSVQQLIQLINAQASAQGGVRDPKMQENYKTILGRIHENLAKSEALERKLWAGLTEKSSAKNH